LRVKSSLEGLQRHNQFLYYSELGQNTELRWATKPIHIDFTLDALKGPKYVSTKQNWTTNLV